MREILILIRLKCDNSLFLDLDDFFIKEKQLYVLMDTIHNVNILTRLEFFLILIFY